MVLVERDYKVMYELERWRYCLGRHVKHFVKFSSTRVCDRRLKVLVDNGYVERKKLLYGVPYIYNLTYQSKNLLNLGLKKDKIILGKLLHDINVLDTVVYFLQKYNIETDSIITEKELHKLDGFSNRKHQSDFVIKFDNKSICVEIELSLKEKDRLLKNIENNFLNYDEQFWIVPKTQSKLIELLNKSKNNFTGLQIIYLEEVQECVKQLN